MICKSLSLHDPEVIYTNDKIDKFFKGIFPPLKSIENGALEEGCRIPGFELFEFD